MKLVDGLREIRPGSTLIRRVQIATAVAAALGFVFLLPLLVAGPPRNLAAGRGSAYAAVLFLIGAGGSLYL